MKPRTMLWLAATMLAVQPGCSQEVRWSAVLDGVRGDFPDVEQISTDSLAHRLAAGAPTLLFDTRTEEEYAVSHIAGATRLDPDDPDFSVLTGVAPDTPIALYCSVGYRSSALARQLADRGFDRVVNVEGSIFKWANEGRPVVRADSAVGVVHGFNRIWGQLLDPALRTYDAPDDGS